MLDASWRGPLGPRSQERREKGFLEHPRVEQFATDILRLPPQIQVASVLELGGSDARVGSMFQGLRGARGSPCTPRQVLRFTGGFLSLRIGRRRSLVQYCARQMCDAERTHLVLRAFPGSVAAMTRTMSLEKPLCSEIHYCSIYVRSANAHATRNPCEFIATPWFCNMYSALGNIGGLE